MRVILIAAFLMGLAGPVSAGFDTGNTLHEQCQDGSGFSSGICMGYAVGVADAMMKKRKLLGYQACFPKGVTRAQVMDVVMAWLTKHPEKRHLAAWSLVIVALDEAFPCPE